MLKRLFDIIISFLGLVFLSPALLLIALFIKHDDRGPVFYCGQRVGKDGQAFGILKFRTMVLNADKIGGPSTSENDPRITKIGTVLRKFKLDELPQIINVIKGEMSIVGPRPEIKSEVDRYAPEWQVIFMVRPGITDLASIEFRDEGVIIANSGIRDSHEAYRMLIQPRKLELQRFYALNHSLEMDMAIIWKTFMVIMKKS